MAALLDRFRSYLFEVPMRRASTVNRYVRLAGDFLDFLGGQTLGAVGKEDLISFLRTRSHPTKPPSPHIWNSRVSALKAFFTFAHGDKLIEDNPALDLPRQRIRPSERLPLSFAEMLALIEATERFSLPKLRARNVAIMYLFLHVSLRVGDLVNLRVRQLDLQAHLFHEAQVKGGKKVLLPFNDLVAEALERWLAVRERYWGDSQDERLFLSREGNGIAVRTVEDLVKRYAKLAGITRPVFPHLLRHSSAHEYAEVTDLMGVQGQLHHDDPKTTEHYIHRSLRKQQDAVERFGERWKSERRKARRVRADPTEEWSEPA